MGLDAVVFCDCYERGRLKCKPGRPGLVRVKPNGELDCRDRNPAVLAEFDAWRETACKHEAGMVAGYSLGNGRTIERLRDAIAQASSTFPVLLGKVLYCGTHCGDYLTMTNVKRLETELDQLKSFRSGDLKLDSELRRLRRQLGKLVRAALKVRKPIAF